MQSPIRKLSHFWQELKRRRVLKVAAMYAATAFIIIEASDIILPRLGLPEWTVTLVIVLLLAGLPVTIILSWIFDLTPEGIARTQPVTSETLEPHSKEGSRRKLRISDGIIAVLLLVVCLLLYPKIFNTDKFGHIRDEDGKVSVAVLPFENLTGEPSNDFWQDGIAEFLINALGSSDELSVVSSQVIQEVLGSSKEISKASISQLQARETAGKINARAYVTGRYIGSPDNISILLNLESSENSDLIWTCRMEGNLVDEYQMLLAQLADTLRNYLEIRSLESRTHIDLSDAFPKSAEAYKYYITGVNAMLEYDTENARSFLLRALEIDSTFTLAAFYMAWVANMSGAYMDEQAYWSHRAYSMKDQLPPDYQTWISLWLAGMEEDTDEVRRVCERMGESDIPSRLFWMDLAVTYSTLLRDYEHAVVHFRKVDSLSKLWNDYLPMWQYYSEYATSLLRIGRLDEMEPIAEIGFQVYPDNLGLVIAMGARSILTGDYEGLTHYKTLIGEINQGDIHPEASNNHDTGDMYELAGQGVTAAAYFKKAYKLDPRRTWSFYKWIRNDLDHGRDLEACMNEIDSALNRHPQDEVILWIKGYALYKMDRNEDALELLEAVDEKIWYNSLLKEDIQSVKLAREATQ